MIILLGDSIINEIVSIKDLEKETPKIYRYTLDSTIINLLVKMLESSPSSSISKYNYNRDEINNITKDEENSKLAQ